MSFLTTILKKTTGKLALSPIRCKGGVSLQLQVVVDPELPPLVEGAVSFETGSTERRLHVYGPGAVGPLVAFFEDLIVGAPMPLVFATHKVAGPHTVVAATLFFCRELAIHPATPGLVYAVDLAHRFGDAMLAHVDADLARFLRGLHGYFPAGLSKRAQGERLATAMQWVRVYIVEGDLPNLGTRPEEVRVLDVGTNGFVLAETQTPSVEAWETLYRAGHIRGVVVGPQEGDFRTILCARKSSQVGFDLERIAPVLDELERLSGGEPGWSMVGNYLHSPAQGSAVLLSHILEVLLHT
jgi:hypothetical protein